MIVLDFGVGVGVWCLSNLIILKIKMSNCLTGDLTANDWENLESRSLLIRMKQNYIQSNCESY